MKPTLNRAPCAKAGIGKTGRDDTAAAPAKPCRRPRRVTSFAPRWSLLIVPSCICARAGWVEVRPGFASDTRHDLRQRPRLGAGQLRPTRLSISDPHEWALDALSLH